MNSNSIRIMPETQEMSVEPFARLKKGITFLRQSRHTFSIVPAEFLGG